MRVADLMRKGLGTNYIKGFTRDAVRKDIYDQVFLRTPDDPWSTIIMHKEERFASTHLYYERLSEFTVNSVYERTGLNFKEFLDLPTFMVEYIVATLRQANSEARKGTGGLENELKKLVEPEFKNSRYRK